MRHNALLVEDVKYELNGCLLQEYVHVTQCTAG